MKSNEIVRSLMERQGLKPTSLAMRMGVSKQVVNNRLKKSKTVAVLVEVCKLMDYKVVVVPSNTRIKPDWYEVTVEEEE